MDTKGYQKLSGAEVRYAVHHIFLPPKLPQSGDDPQAAAHEKVLLGVVLDALQAFRAYVNAGDKIVIDAAHSATRRLRDIRDTHGSANEKGLRDAFHDLAQTGS
jgi:hypothetical protein